MQKEMQEWRRDLHKIPEIGLKEYKTSSEIKELTQKQAENLRYYQDKLNQIKDHKSRISRIIPEIRKAFAGNFEPTPPPPPSKPPEDFNYMDDLPGEFMGDMPSEEGTLSSDEMNALLSRGFEKDAINDVLSQGGIDSLRDILSGNIEAGFFSGDSKKPLDISKLRSTLYLRYMTGNKKPFTEKNLSKQQLKSLERQVIQNLTTKSLATTNLVSNLGSATKDITGTLNKRQRFALGLDKNDFVYTVSSYTKTPMKDNDLRYLLGNYIVITTVRNGKRVVKEIRDDFDFKYGYEVDRSDGSFAGDPYKKRKKGGQSVDLGRGIFVGSETGGEDPFKVKAGRTGVNIGAGLGIGSPVPIKIKFVKESVNESNLFNKIKKNKKNK